jgi:hypothetical protein
MRTEFLVGSLERGHHLDDIGIDRSIQFIRVLTKQGGRVWTGLYFVRGTELLAK